MRQEIKQQVAPSGVSQHRHKIIFAATLVLIVAIAIFIYFGSGKSFGFALQGTTSADDLPIYSIAFKEIATTGTILPTDATFDLTVKADLGLKESSNFDIYIDLGTLAYQPAKTFDYVPADWETSHAVWQAANPTLVNPLWKEEVLAGNLLHIKRSFLAKGTPIKNELDLFKITLKVPEKSKVGATYPISIQSSNSIIYGSDSQNIIDASKVQAPISITVEAAKVLDTDNDGTPDSEDICPNDPKDDEDNDGICVGKASTILTGKKSDDNCPTIKNVDQADFDKNGVGDVCQDSDGDGILDTADGCPNTPAGTKVDATGCPVTICKGGETKCDDAGNVATCKADGSGYGVGVACAAGNICNAGACEVKPVCVAGQQETCDSKDPTNILKCNAAGTGYESLTSCAAGENCVEPTVGKMTVTCAAPVCPAGSGGVYPACVCTAGDYVSATNSCVSCTDDASCVATNLGNFCEVATGKCQASDPNAANDVNFCATANGCMSNTNGKVECDLTAIPKVCVTPAAGLKADIAIPKNQCVDQLDFIELAKSWNQCEGDAKYIVRANIDATLSNGKQCVNQLDFIGLATEWNKGSGCAK